MRIRYSSSSNSRCVRSIWRCVARDLVGVGVQREIADAQRGHAARRAAPQQRAHAGQQLLALERLDEIVVGADVQPLHARLQRVAGGEHQDRRVVAVVAQALGDVDAVQPRQTEVQDDDVRQEGVRLVEAAHAVAGELDLVALEAQRALQDLRDLLVVLDDEHAYGTAGGIHYVFMLRAPRRFDDLQPPFRSVAHAAPCRRAGVAARASKGAGPDADRQEEARPQAGAAPRAPFRAAFPPARRSSSASST